MSESTCFFNFLSTIKVNLVLKSCKVLIYVLFYMSRTEKLPLIAILTSFLILGKIQAYCNPLIAHDMNGARCEKGRPHDRGKLPL